MKTPEPELPSRQQAIIFGVHRKSSQANWSTDCLWKLGHKTSVNQVVVISDYPTWVSSEARTQNMRHRSERAISRRQIWNCATSHNHLHLIFKEIKCSIANATLACLEKSKWTTIITIKTEKDCDKLCKHMHRRQCAGMFDTIKHHLTVLLNSCSHRFSHIALTSALCKIMCFQSRRT